MESVQIDTAHHVRIHLPVAGIGDRCLAALTDSLLITAVSLALMILLVFLKNRMDHIAWIVLIVIFYLPISLYHLVCEVWMDGQSIGKRLQKIRVIKMDGSQPGFAAYLIRWSFRIIDISLTGGSVGLITLLINGKGQRLGDLAAGTTVIHTTTDISLDDTIYQDVEANYQITFPEAVKLDEKIVTLIKEVLNVKLEHRRHRVNRSNVHLKMVEQVEKKLGIQNTMHPKTFLITVLKDYNYLKSHL